MRITATGHAGLNVETARATLLIDPWFSPEGAFQGSWFQYPENSHLLGAKLARPTAIVISHEHLDHVDPWFLAQVPNSVPVIIPRYPSPVLKRKILKGGPREIVEADQWEVVSAVDGVELFFVSEPPMNHDSAIVVRADGYSLLNLNDARLFPVQLREIRRMLGGTVDAFAFQGAGASWFPMCYGYPPEKARELSRRKRLGKFAFCLKTMRIVEPVIGLPVAGPPAFLDPELFALNREMEDPGVFPDQQQIADWLRGHGVDNTAVLLPGDAWDAGSRAKIADSHWDDFSFEDRWSYLEGYQARRRAAIACVRSRFPQPRESLFEPFARYMEGLLGLSPYFNARIDMRVGFDITGNGGGQWAVDFRSAHQGIGTGLDDCGYLFRFESRWLPSLLNGDTPWEDFFLSLRFEARRHPDRYNDHLLGLLKFADRESLSDVERFETTERSSETISVHSEGQLYTLSRYCPHAGNDLLETGEVLPGGILRCLAHHYEFDLRSGQCITGNCDPIRVSSAPDPDEAVAHNAPDAVQPRKMAGRASSSTPEGH